MPTVQPYSATAQVKSLAGTAALPGITFTGDTDTGFYSPAANQVAITTGGVQRLLIGSDGSITPSGSFLFPSGTAAAPSLSFVGDANTGIYSPGADQVAISTGGSGRLFVDASGRLGIGTSSPNYTLDVAGTINANATVRTSNGTHIGILGSEAFAAGVVGVGSTSNHPLVLGTNSLERLRITSAGLVGIGTSSPTQLLTVIGSSFVGSSFNGQTIGDGSAERIRIGYKDGNPDTGLVPAQILTDATTLSIAARDIVNSAIRFHTGSGTSERVRIDSAGQVGIGTSTPTENLTIYGASSRFSVTGPSGSSVILLGNQNSSGANNPSVIEAANGALYFGGGNSWSGGGTFDYTMTLTNDNKVGIGSTNPNHLLSVTASAGAQDIFLAGQIGVSNGYQITSNGTALTHAWFNSGSEAARIDSSGRVGIGTSSPSEKLTVAGTSGSAAISLLETGVRNWAIRAGGAVTNSLDIADLTAGATRLTVNSSGFVGIGTSTPQASLDIASGTFQAVRTNLSSVTDTFHQYRGTPDGVGYEHARVFSGRDTSVHTYGSYLAFYTEGKASGTTDTSLERLRIDSSGRVGIGTTSPAVNAHIFGSQAALRIESSNTDARLQLTSSSGTWVVGNSVGGTGNYLSFYDVTASSERARIDSSGRLGIGTTSPSGKTEIVSSGSESTLILRNSNGAPSTYSELKFAPFTGTTAAAAAIRAEYYQDDNSSLAFRTTNTNAEPTTKMFIDQVGRVGIGTSTPSFTAHVSGAKNTTQLFVAAPTISAVNDFTQIGFGLSNTEFGLIRLGFDNPSAITNSYFSFFNNNGSGLQESLRIDSSGRVGIGTSSPTAPLQVVTTSAAYTTSMLAIGEQSNATGKQLYFGMHTTDGKGYIQSVHWGTSYKELLLNPNGGNVGIGTSSPSRNLDITAGQANVGITSNTTSAGNEPTLVFTHAGNNSYVIKGGNNLQFASDAGTNVRMTLTTAGSLGIGTTSPGYALDVASSVVQVGNSTDAFVQYKSTAGNWHVGANSSNAYVFYSGTYGSGSERARIDSSGRLLVGTSSARQNLFNTTYSALLQVESQTTGNAQASFTSSTAGINGANLILCHQRSGSSGGNTIVQAEDQLGIVSFQGADGTEMVPAASVEVYVDGTPGANDMPGRLVFSTTADGASSPTERLRITSAGLVGVGTSSPGAQLDLVGTAPGQGLIRTSNGTTTSFFGATATSFAFWNSGLNPFPALAIGTTTNHPIVFGTNNIGRVVVDTSGNVGIGTSSPSQSLQVVGAIASTGQAPALTPSSTFFDYITSLNTARFAAVGNTTGTTAPIYFSQYSSNGSVGRDAVAIDSSGNVGIGTTSPGAKLHVQEDQAAYSYFDFYNVTAGGGIVWRQIVRNIANTGTTSVDFVKYLTSGFAINNNDTHSANFTAFNVGASERMRLDSSGRLLVGTSSAAQYNSYSSNNLVQLARAGDSPDIQATSFRNDQFGTVINLGKSRSATIGTNTAVQDGDWLGTLNFVGANGASWVEGARITGFADGQTWSNGDCPGRLVFSTTADGASSPTERMRITSAGNVGIGTASPNSRLAVNGSITESTDGGTTYHNVVTTQDIGTDPNQVPLNQFLGQLAFMDKVGDVPTASAPPQDNLSVNFEYISNTSIKIRMRGTDGVVRSVTLTLS